MFMSCDIVHLDTQVRWHMQRTKTSLWCLWSVFCCPLAWSPRSTLYRCYLLCRFVFWDTWSKLSKGLLVPIMLSFVAKVMHCCAKSYLLYHITLLMMLLKKNESFYVLYVSCVWDHFPSSKNGVKMYSEDLAKNINTNNNIILAIISDVVDHRADII